MYFETFLPFSSHSKLSANAFNLEESTISRLGKGLLKAFAKHKLNVVQTGNLCLKGKKT